MCSNKVQPCSLNLRDDAPKPYIFPNVEKRNSNPPHLEFEKDKLLHFCQIATNDQTVFVNANLKAVCSLHAFYPTACVSTHAVVLCDMNGRQMPLSPAPTSSSVPLGLIRRGYVSHKYIGPSVTP